MNKRKSNADVHIHTNYSDGFHDPETIINYAVAQTDLRVIAITDHNTVDGARRACEYWQQHRAEFGQLEVIPGVEVSSSKGHIIGLYVKENIPPHMSPADTVRAIHEQGGLAIAAHPFTHLLAPFTDLHGVGTEIAELPLDGVEVRNSAPTELYSNWITEQFNRRHRNHPTIGGSDTHYLTMMGRAFTTFPGRTAEDFRRALKAGKVTASGRVNGPGVVMQVLQHLWRQRGPFFLPSDRHYRHDVPGLRLQVEEGHPGRGVIIRCSGELTRATSHILKEAGLRLLDGRRRRLVIDLEGISFVDSSGLGSLVAIHKRCHAVAGELALSGVPNQVQSAINLARLDAIFAIYDGSAQAIEALSSQRTGRAAAGAQ